MKALKKKEVIGLFGDYDVDGATSIALLTRYFSLIKQSVKTFIPDRKKDGYGPSVNGFNYLIDLGSKVIFTVDCGTLSFAPISDAKKKNIDVIVLDHHQSDTKLPEAYALVNPNRYDDQSNLNYLCAAGVCFMFLVAMNKTLRINDWFKINKIEEPNILNLLDLVSLGTVCDVVPLIGLNRAIVKQGLKIIKKKKNLGLKTLYDLCKIESKPSTFDLGYKLGPRINAGGRVGKSSLGAELLISDDPKRVYEIANDLDRANNERKSIEYILLKLVESEAKKYHNHPVLVLSGKDWHEGVIGIIASRIKDKYNKPTIIISCSDKFGKGSARSVFGFDIGTQIINAVRLGILQKGGGHKMAGGFTIDLDQISIFRNLLLKTFEKFSLDISQEKNVQIDSIIAPSAVNEDFYNDINSLAPFGSGNHEPVFAIENLRVIRSDLVGSDHIKSILSGKDGSIIKSIAFNAKNTPLEGFLNKNNKQIFSVVGKLNLNEWNGKKDIQFVISDIGKNNIS